MNNTGPTFFIVGAAKAGTTSLARYLAQHPDVYIPPLKEPKFLSAAENTFPHTGPGDAEVDAKVVRDLDDYLALFAPGNNAAARGEASVDNLYFKGVPGRMRELFPQARVVMVLRDPAARAWSAYMHMVRDGRETLSFEEALQAEERRREANWEFIWHYARYGLYHDRVAAYLQAFTPERVLTLRFEDLTQNPLGLCRTIFEFLEIDPAFEPDISLRHNVSGNPKSRGLHTLLHSENFIKTMVKRVTPSRLRARLRRRMDALNLEQRAMNPGTRTRLAAFYADDVRRLEALLGTELSHWRNAHGRAETEGGGQGREKQL